MANAITVLGPIKAEEMGYTLTHEHICSSSPGFWQIWPEIFGGREAYVERIGGVLAQAKAEGVGTYVDLTTIDLGRDIRLIEAISQRSGVHVICCTGHWLDPSRSMGMRTTDELESLLRKEIEEGIEGTSIRAGVIKVANDAEITEFGEKLLRAAARAAKATGVPISTHTNARARTGDRQAAIFEEEGVDPAQVYIGHSDDTDDIEYLAGLAGRGYSLGMDRLPFGLQGPNGPAPALPIAKRVAVIRELIDRGYGDKIMLSHDQSLGRANFPTDRWEGIAARNPDGVLFVIRKVIPLMREAGISESAIEQMTVGNPARFFGRF